MTGAGLRDNCVESIAGLECLLGRNHDRSCIGHLLAEQMEASAFRQQPISKSALAALRYFT